MQAQPARRHPVLHQLDARVLLRERGDRLGRPATLDDLPDAQLDQIAEDRFDRAWPLGAWQTGPATQAGERQRLARRGLRLMLDFVPNHVSPDHPGLDLAVVNLGPAPVPAPRRRAVPPGAVPRLPAWGFHVFEVAPA